MLKRLLPLFLVFVIYTAKAQQQGQYSQYMLNYYMINPAVAGTEDFIDFKSGYRMQWTGFNGAPRNYYLSGHTALGKVNTRRMAGVARTPHHAVGAIVSGQKVGLFSHNTAYFTYAYHLPLSRTGVLSIGAQAGVNQYAFDRNSAYFGEEGMPETAVVAANQIKFDMGIGAWFYTPKLFIGLSSVQLLKSKISYLNPNEDNGYLDRHYYLTGGYKVKFSRFWAFIPSVLLKGTTTAYQVDVNGKLKFSNLYWFGASYRHTDAVALLAGFAVPLTKTRHNQRHGNNTMLEFSYCYDVTTSRLRSYSYGTHEIVVGLRLPTAGKKLASPSDFW